jgi:hypothetical protein
MRGSVCWPRSRLSLLRKSHTPLSSNLTNNRYPRSKKRLQIIDDQASRYHPSFLLSLFLIWRNVISSQKKLQSIGPTIPEYKHTESQLENYWQRSMEHGLYYVRGCTTSKDNYHACMGELVHHLQPWRRHGSSCSTIVNLPMPDMPMNSLPLLTRKPYHLTIVFKIHRVLPTFNVPSDENWNSIR